MTAQARPAATRVLWIVSTFGMALNTAWCLGAERVGLEVRETAGIRRFGYPVGTVLELGTPVPANTPFRLLDNGKPIAAQFRPVLNSGDMIRSVSLDFEVNFMPNESRAYEIEYGPDTVAPPEPDRGLAVQETEQSFEISHGQSLVWTIPRNLRGLLHSVKTPKADYLRPESAGLILRDRNGRSIRMGGAEPGDLPVTAHVIKRGAVATAIHFKSGDEFRRRSGFSAVVDLAFPRSKSWVQVTWTVDDPGDSVAGLAADLNLNIAGEPTLVDFGAGSLVYAAVAAGQSATLLGRPTAPEQPGRRLWETLRGPVGKLDPYVLGPEGDAGAPAEGWAHVMDRERCTAVAVREFAKRWTDRIEVAAGGRLQVAREFPPRTGPQAKSLVFWLHFVPMPPHVGAVTSPQSMQSPLEITWRPRGESKPGQTSDGNPTTAGPVAQPAPEVKQQSEVDRLAARARTALAQTSGELRLRGLQAKVEVLRDRWGVPHLYAENAADLFFAQGFVQAQDRLWQMEIWRRTTEGRLAEIVGPAAVERDRMARLLQFRGDMAAEWASYSPDARSIIEAFVRGVNAFIELCRDRPPIEFQLTSIQPQPWTPEVCLGRMAGYIMCRNASAEVLRAELIRELGPELTDRLLPTDPARPIVVPHGLDLNLIDQRIISGLNTVTAAVKLPLSGGNDSAAPARTGEGPKPGDEGSNNWTVSGRLTTTGKPMLANDPHRPVTLPSLRYLVHLVCPARGEDRGWNVIGGTEPALPGVTIGHNDRVGWGLTIVGTDQQDLYVEVTHPDDPDRYRAGEEWLAMQVQSEEIAVRGEAKPRRVKLKFTRHGPVIFEDAERHRAYALRWTGSEPGTAGYLAALALDRVRNWQEFLEAAARWKLPSENLVYADVDGHIGWIAAAMTPIRPSWDGLLPVPGESGRYEWAGFLPIADLPQKFDPAEGYIATANHNILPSGYSKAISYEWSAPFRYQRINQVFRSGIDAGGRFSVKDFEDLQHDAVSLPARRLLAVLRQAVRGQESPAPELALLLAWDGRLGRDSAAAALYEVWQRKLAERVLQAQIPGKYWERYANRLPLEAVIDMVERAAFPPCDGRAAQRDAIALETLREASADLRKRLGDDTGAWRWGSLHQLTLRHMLAGTPALDKVLNLETVPRDGDGFTPLATGGSGFGKFDQTTGASYRHILDVADWDRSVATSVPGESGQPGSPHYGDLLPLWAEGKYFPLPFSRRAVESATSNTLILSP